MENSEWYTHPRWATEEPNEKKESVWYIDAIKEGIRQAESGCKDCKYEYRKNLSNSEEPCNDCDIAHGWTPKEEEPKKSGRYPWGEVKDKNIYTYAGWVQENMANRDPLLTLEEIHIYMDLRLKASIADELHHLNKILERRKG